MFSSTKLSRHAVMEFPHNLRNLAHPALETLYSKANNRPRSGKMNKLVHASKRLVATNMMVSMLVSPQTRSTLQPAALQRARRYVRDHFQFRPIVKIAPRVSRGLHAADLAISSLRRATRALKACRHSTRSTMANSRRSRCTPRCRSAATIAAACSGSRPGTSLAAK